jgi:hypothetical protein
LLLLLLCASCVSVRDELDSVAALYRDARYEAAQAWFVELRRDYPAMSADERAIYHYLSGMTAYRLAQPEEARHELALAAVAAKQRSTALRPSQTAVLNRTLEELNASALSSPASP